MSSDINRWQGTMNLGGDAELRFTQGGQPVLNFRGACTERYLDANKQEKETTTWVPCVLWGKRGQALAPHLIKGTRLYIEGTLRIGSYDDKEGVKRVKVEVNVRELQFMGGKRAGGGDEHDDGGSGEDGEGSDAQQTGGYSRGPAQHTSQSSTGYAPRGSAKSAGDFEVAFGRDKGKRISQVDDLSWLRGTLERDLADGSKERFHEKARGQLAAIDAELARRTGGGARTIASGGGQRPIVAPEDQRSPDYQPDPDGFDDSDIPF